MSISLLSPDAADARVVLMMLNLEKVGRLALGNSYKRNMVEKACTVTLKMMNQINISMVLRARMPDEYGARGVCNKFFVSISNPCILPRNTMHLECC